MGFQKHKAGIILAILCLLAVMAVVWFCLMPHGRKAEPEGTLVEWQTDLPEGILAGRQAGRPEVMV